MVCNWQLGLLLLCWLVLAGPEIGFLLLIPSRVLKCISGAVCSCLYLKMAMRIWNVWLVYVYSCNTATQLNVTSGLLKLGLPVLTAGLSPTCSSPVGMLLAGEGGKDSYELQIDRRMQN